MAEAEDIVLQEIDKLMDDFTDRIFQISQEKLIQDGKIDTANLLKSGNINRKFLEKEIIYSAPYADIIEYGRQPGTMPPPAALEKWVRRKLGVADKDARRVAFLVARKIKQRGTDPSPYIEPAIAQARIEFKI